MALFNEEILTVQDEYVRVDPSREDENNDDDLEYSNDDLGENTEVTPLGDAVEDDDIDNLYKIGPDDDDELGDDEDIDIDTLEVDEDDEIEDLSAQIAPDDDDDLLSDDEDDDLLDDDDDLDFESPAAAPELDDEDLLSVDDDDDTFDDDDEVTPSSSIDTDTDFSSRDHGRVTGTMIDHEPGLGGSDRKDYNL